MLIHAGTAEQLSADVAQYSTTTTVPTRAVIIGGGRVGRAVATASAAKGIEYVIVEQLAERRREGFDDVIGDAADRSVLEAAGIGEAGAILITTHDDNVNVFLTRYCRGLRPDARIASRSKLDRNVSTLYRAGADSVLSYAGTGSAAIWNHLRGDETVLVVQELNVFRTPIPKELAGATLADTHVHRHTSCNIVAVERNGVLEGSPDPPSRCRSPARSCSSAPTSPKPGSPRCFPVPAGAQCCAVEIASGETGVPSDLRAVR